MAGKGWTWTWQRWSLRIPEGPDALDQPRRPGAQRGAWERRVPPGSRPIDSLNEPARDGILQYLETRREQ